MLRTQHRFFRSVLITADGLVIIAASILAYYVRFHLLNERFPPNEPHWSYVSHAIPVLATLPLMLVALLWTGSYEPRRDQPFAREAVTILKAMVVGVILTYLFLNLFQKPLFDGRDFSRGQFVLFLVIACGMMLTWRFAFRMSLRSIRSKGWNLRHVAIIGTGRLGQVVCHTLCRNSWTGITPRCFISHHPTTKRKECLGLPVRGGTNDLKRILDEQDVSGVIIALPGRMVGETAKLITELERYPIDVRIVPDMNPRFLPINMAVNELDGMPVLSVRESPLAGWGRISKRLLDIAGSIGSLLIFAVPMLIIAIMIRRSGPGPIIFRQERMTLNGQRFRIYKFRTMTHVEAEQQAIDERENGTAAWTKKNDSRVTPIGRFLRRTSLDELPQLLNVLLGEMSLVGPRPERPELIEQFREDWRGYMLRQNVKAGMTGWAQVNGLRGDTSLRKRLQYDLFYIRNWSLMFDIRILWMTIFKGFVHPNAH